MPPPARWTMGLHLCVVDGADKGATFVLPESGTVVVGNNRRHAEVYLNDLYVSRHHCEIEAAGDHVIVTAGDTPSGTLLNGVKISHQAMHLGDVLRVGNSHLRLDPLEGGPEPIDT